MYKPPGGLYLEGRFNGGFFPLPVWGAYIWRSLYMDGLIFGILRCKGRVQRDHKTIPSTKRMTLVTVQEPASTVPSLSPF